jgi:hypothetical protein
MSAPDISLVFDRIHFVAKIELVAELFPQLGKDIRYALSFKKIYCFYAVNFRHAGIIHKQGAINPNILVKPLSQLFYLGFCAVCR